MRIFTILSYFNILLVQGFLTNMYGLPGTRRMFRNAVIDPDNNDNIRKKWMKNKDYERSRRFRKIQRRHKAKKEKQKRETEAVKQAWKTLEETLLNEKTENNVIEHSSRLDEELTNNLLNEYDSWMNDRFYYRSVNINQVINNNLEYRNGKRADDFFTNETKRDYKVPF